MLNLKSATVITRSQRFSNAIKDTPSPPLRSNMTPTMRGKQKDTSKQSTPQSIKNAIQIMCEDQMLSVCANTFEEREKWIEALEDITQVFITCLYEIND